MSQYDTNYLSFASDDNSFTAYITENKERIQEIGQIFQTFQESEEKTPKTGSQ